MWLSDLEKGMLVYVREFHGLPIIYECKVLRWSSTYAQLEHKGEVFNSLLSEVMEVPIVGGLSQEELANVRVERYDDPGNGA